MRLDAVVVGDPSTPGACRSGKAVYSVYARFRKLYKGSSHIEAFANSVTGVHGVDSRSRYVRPPRVGRAAEEAEERSPTGEAPRGLSPPPTVSTSTEHRRSGSNQAGPDAGSDLSYRDRHSEEGRSRPKRLISKAASNLSDLSYLQLSREISSCIKQQHFPLICARGGRRERAGQVGQAPDNEGLSRRARSDAGLAKVGPCAAGLEDRPSIGVSVTLAIRAWEPASAPVAPGALASPRGAAPAPR